jgi:1,4-dihydroxy-2-naphthoyl-CoA hydrolase
VCAVADDLTAQIHTAMPFTALLGATALRAGPDEVVLCLDWDATRCTSGGLLHGGVR